MGELSPVIEGHAKCREGKKWKSRFARVTRLSPVADCLTLQLWRDAKEVERGLAPTKGSINLADYIGWESSFNLDRESHTLALVFREMVVILALDARETLIKWQVRLTGQYEEGLAIPVHLVSAPKKAKTAPGPCRIHLQNGRFSLTSGVPPALGHSWEMVDLRRYGAVEGGRFCFEGGTRCGRGEGLHVFRVDNAEDIQISFDLASKSRLESKKRGGSQGFTMSTSPSVSSNMCQKSETSGSSLSTLLSNSSFRSTEELERSRSRSRSRSVNPSLAWSSVEMGLALSSPDTLSLTLSEVEAGGPAVSPDHLVSRRTVLERIGLAAVENGLSPGHQRAQPGSRSCGSEDDFYLNWQVEKRPGPAFRRQGSTNTHSIDRLSLSSGDSGPHSTYDHPKTVLKVTSSPKSLKRNTSVASCGPPSSLNGMSPYAKSLRRAMSERASSVSSFGPGPDMRRMIAATPCPCSGATPGSAATVGQVEGGQGAGYENYDIPRNLGRQEAMQFYDTPRNVREAIECPPPNPLGNYDYPTAGPLPVFRKPCGCIMKLTSQDDPTSEQVGEVMTWTCLREGEGGDLGGESSQLKVPRVRLTGQGKMPVVDMSKVNAMRCLSEPPRAPGQRPLSPPPVTGLPPRHASPLYAQVDKSKKSCPACQGEAGPHRCAASRPLSPSTNYINLDFANSLSLYENSRDVLSRLAAPPLKAPGDERQEYRNPEPSQPLSPSRRQAVAGPPPIFLAGPPPASLPLPSTSGNYLDMSPGRHGGPGVTDYEMMQFQQRRNSDVSPIGDTPLIGFSPVNPLCESVESMVLMCDSKFNTIKQMPKNGHKTEEESLAMSRSCHGNIPTQPAAAPSPLVLNILPNSAFCSGYVTIPRSRMSDNMLCSLSRSSSNGSTVTMRRSASVPCKRDRDSSSSGGSDSGVSTGSPRQSVAEQLDFLKLEV